MKRTISSSLKQTRRPITEELAEAIAVKFIINCP